MGGYRPSYRCLEALYKAVASSIGSGAWIAGIDPSAGRSPWGVTIISIERPCHAVIKYCGVIEPGRAYQVHRLTLRTPLLVVDAPLSTPYRGFRVVERLALKEGARLLPGGLKSMEALTVKGFSLCISAYESGKLVVETHPSSALSFMRVRGLEMYTNTHARDSLVAAIVGLLLASNMARVYRGGDGVLVLPAKHVEVVVGGGRIRAYCRADPPGPGGAGGGI